MCNPYAADGPYMADEQQMTAAVFKVSTGWMSNLHMTLHLTLSLVRPRNNKNSPWTIHSIDSCSLLTAPPAYKLITWPDAKDAAYSKVCSNNAAAVQRIKGHLQAAEAT